MTSALTFDIKGYFDFVNHARLLREMCRKKIPLPIVRWAASFLTNCEAAICLDSVRGEMEPVENGIPQGSPISPQKIGLGSKAEVYDAEMTSLTWGAQDATQFAAAYHDIKHLHFFAYNTSAIQAIFEPRLRRRAKMRIPIPRTDYPVLGRGYIVHRRDCVVTRPL